MASWDIIHKSREKHLANNVVKPCKGTLPKSIDLQRPGQRYPNGNPGISWLRSRSDVVLVLVFYNYGKKVGGLRARLQMKVILPGSYVNKSEKTRFETKMTHRYVLPV